MDDYTTIVPGQTLTSYPLDKMRAKSLRIDNPSGCWYRVENNKQVIPPFTYGTLINLQAQSSALTITFLPTYANQQSKIVGNSVAVYISDAAVLPSNPLSIQSAIPYINTFGAVFSHTTVNAVRNVFVSIWPLVPMRIRLTHFNLNISPRAGITTGVLVTGFQISRSTSDGAGFVLSPLSQDGDPSVVSQCIVRSNMPTLGAIPAVAAADVIRTWRFFAAGIAIGSFGRSFPLNDPSSPPSIYSVASSQRGIVLGWSIAGATTPDLASGCSIGWTEEPLN